MIALWALTFCFQCFDVDFCVFEWDFAMVEYQCCVEYLYGYKF